MRHLGHDNPNFDFVARYALAKRIHERGFKIVLGGESSVREPKGGVGYGFLHFPVQFPSHFRRSSWPLTGLANDLGSGADDIFGGYRAFLPDFLSEPDLTWPSLPRQEARHPPVSNSTPTGPARYNETDLEGDRPDSLTKSMLGGSCIGFSTWTNRTWDFPWAKWVVARHGGRNIERTRTYDLDVQTQCAMDTWHPFHVAMYFWRATVLPVTELAMLCDRPAMAFSVEGRPPFLSRPLVEYADGLPPSMKIRMILGRICTKYVLRIACRDFVTEEVFYREKHVRPRSVLLEVFGPGLTAVGRRFRHLPDRIATTVP